MTQRQLGPHAMDSVRAGRRGHLRWEVFEPLAVDDQHVPRLGGTACLVEEPPQQELSAQSSSPRTTMTLIGLSPCFASAALRSARRFVTSLLSAGFTRP